MPVGKIMSAPWDELISMAVYTSLHQEKTKSMSNGKHNSVGASS